MEGRLVRGLGRTKTSSPKSGVHRLWQRREGGDRTGERGDGWDRHVLACLPGDGGGEREASRLTIPLVFVERERQGERERQRELIERTKQTGKRDFRFARAQVGLRGGRLKNGVLRIQHGRREERVRQPTGVGCPSHCSELRPTPRHSLTHESPPLVLAISTQATCHGVLGLIHEARNKEPFPPHTGEVSSLGVHCAMGLHVTTAPLQNFLTR